MVMRKRLLVIGVTIILLLATLTGCLKRPDPGAQSQTAASTVTPAETSSTTAAAQSSATPQLQGKIVVWVGDTVKPMFDELGQSFKAQTGVDVEIVPFTGLSATDKLALDGPAGKGGDVYMQGDGGVLGKAAEQGLFMPLLENQVGLDRFTPGSVDGYYYKGQLYGLPMGLETPALIYNKKLISSIPDNWDDMISVTKKLADVQNDKYGFLMDIGNPYFFIPLFDAEGGYVFKETDGKYDVNDIGLNNVGSKKVYSMLAGYLKDGVLVPNMGFDVMEKKFSEGKAAVIYDGPWAVNNYKSAGIDIGIAPLPKFANGNYPRTFSGAYGLAVSSYTKNPDAAIAFLNFATSKDSEIKYFAATKRTPPLKEALELDTIKNDPIVQGFAQQLQHSMPQPNVAEMDMIWGPLMDSTSVILSKNAPVDETLDKAVAKIKEQIQTMKK